MPSDPVRRAAAVQAVEFARRLTSGKIPLAVGFGVSKPEHVKQLIAAGADAVVVGSAIVDLVEGVSEDKVGSLGRVQAYVGLLRRASVHR